MIRRQTSIISIAGEETLHFLMRGTDGSLNTVASMPLEAFIQGTSGTGELPRAALEPVHQTLIVPDYWVGCRFHAFQAYKKSVVAAFIERQLKKDHPDLTEVADFYNFALVRGRDQSRHLYAFYLQEAIAYRLYRRMDALGISPRQVTTPALVWQGKLGGMVDGFGGQGVGFIHLGETDCFLYFYFMGQFLFSRTIELPDTVGDESQTYNLLNYEINQSFYLYSQKTKSSVDALFMLAPDPAAAPHLSELLGREVHGLPHLPLPADMPDGSVVSPPCRSFSVPDLTNRGGPSIAYAPLKKELAWRPVQWAGILVGVFLAVLLVLESGFLHHRSQVADRQRRQLVSAIAKPPERVLADLSLALDDITRELARPSGSGTIMRALLAMPDGVTVKSMSLDGSTAPYLKIDAVVDADHPDAFKAKLEAFLTQLNGRFDLRTRPLRENDVTIRLDRSENNDGKPVYRINVGFEIS